MKKLILGCAAVLFTIGSIAQVQDTTNNNLRQDTQGPEQVGEEMKDADQPKRSNGHEPAY